jgi:hypothetical protein
MNTSIQNWNENQRKIIARQIRFTKSDDRLLREIMLKDSASNFSDYVRQKLFRSDDLLLARYDEILKNQNKITEILIEIFNNVNEAKDDKKDS